MSAEVIRDFFPETTKFVLSNALLRTIWFYVFPQYAEEMCPTPFISVSLPFTDGILSVKWPFVAASCVVGIVLGLVAGGRLLLLSRARGAGNSSGCFVSGLAFVWYAAMCVGALLYHCVHRHAAFYFIDLVSTGSSSVSIGFGLAAFDKRVDDRHLKWLSFIVVIYVLLSIIGMTASQVIREQIYLAPTLLAAVLGMRFLGKRLVNSGKQGRLIRDLTTDSPLLWTSIATICLTIAGASLVGDRFLCFAFGSNGSFLLWFFLCCDVIFACTYKLVILMHKERLESKKCS